MQVSNVLGTCRRLLQLLFLYLQLNQSIITTRLTAVKAPHSDDWLNAAPITSCGLHMEDNKIPVAFGLCLGVSLCELLQYTYVNIVNTRGNHGLSGKRSIGRTLRHNIQAGLPSTKEPAGLLRTNGK